MTNIAGADTCLLKKWAESPKIHLERNDDVLGDAAGYGEHGQPVRRFGRDVPVYEIRRRAGLLVSAHRHGTAPPMAGTDKAGLAHEPGNPLVAVPLPGAAQLGMNPRRAIGLA